MSFWEKSAWITLCATIVVYSGYFAVIGPDLFGRDALELGFLKPLLASIILLIMLQIALHIMAAALTPKDARAPQDEREQTIELQSMRAGFYVLQACIFFAIAALCWGANVRVMANIMILIMVIGEIARLGWQVVDFRRKAA